MGDEEIPYDDIAEFIVQVRKLVSKDYDSRSEYQRVCRRIKNLSTRLFRDHIGYTPEGGYRLKARNERMFRDAIEEAGGGDRALSKFAGQSPHLGKILRGNPPLEPSADAGKDPPPPLHLVQREVPLPKWAEDFDPESEEPVDAPRVRPPSLVDLEDLGEEGLEELEFEVTRLEEDLD
jgi:hypothetical protein